MKKYRFDESQHLHLLDEKPLSGTSSVVGVLSKPLTWWASGKALELLGWTPTKTNKQDRLETAAYRFDEIRNYTHGQYLSLLDKAYRNHKDSLHDSATKGIDLHADIENFIKLTMQGKKGFPYNERIQPFVEWSQKNVKRFIWSEAHCYSEKLWCGGISDFGVELNDGSVCLGDIKSSKEAYTSHFLQGAGYCLLIEENGLFDKDGKKIGEPMKFDGLIIVPFGADYIEPKFNPIVLDEYKKGFKAAVELYRLMGEEQKEK